MTLSSGALPSTHLIYILSSVSSGSLLVGILIVFIGILACEDIAIHTTSSYSSEAIASLGTLSITSFVMVIKSMHI